jgi:hypothetical protein
MAEESRYRKHRVGTGSAKSLTLEKIHSYLAPFEKEEKTTFSVTEMQIQPTSIPSKLDKEHFKQFKSCFGSNESLHHGYLKWFALNFLKEIIKEKVDIDYIIEASSYIPNNKYWMRSGYKSYGRVLRKREAIEFGQHYNHTGQPEHWIQEIDAAAIVRSPIIECGATSTMSLALPLTTGMASVIYWLPFTTPEKKEHRSKEWEDFETPLKAFEISLA